MGGGNGMKSKTKRDRNAAKNAKTSGNSSQLSSNSKAMNIVCKICRAVRSSPPDPWPVFYFLFPLVLSIATLTLVQEDLLT